MVSALKPPGYEDAQKVIHSDGLLKALKAIYLDISAVYVCVSNK